METELGYILVLETCAIPFEAFDEDFRQRIYLLLEHSSLIQIFEVGNKELHRKRKVEATLFGQIEFEGIFQPANRHKCF